jgi:hypothetical protein
MNLQIHIFNLSTRWEWPVFIPTILPLEGGEEPPASIAQESGVGPGTNLDSVEKRSCAPARNQTLILQPSRICSNESQFWNLFNVPCYNLCQPPYRWKLEIFSLFIIPFDSGHYIYFDIKNIWKSDKLWCCMEN